MPVGEPHGAFAREVEAALRQRGVRVRVDDRNESLSRRILDVHRALVPFALVIGNKEVAARSVAVRARDEQRVLDLPAALEEIGAACRIPRRSAGQSAFGDPPE